MFVFIVHSGKTIHTECEVIITDNIGDRCKACEVHKMITASLFVYSYADPPYMHCPVV